MLKKLLVLPICFLLVAVVRLGAQDPVEFPDISTLTPENIFGSLYDPVYSMLVVLFGYISAFVPGLKKLSTYGRVLAFGLIAGLGFYLFGFADVWKIAISFLISTGLLYDGFLKPFTALLQNLFKKSQSAPAKG